MSCERFPFYNISAHNRLIKITPKKTIIKYDPNSIDRSKNKTATVKHSFFRIRENLIRAKYENCENRMNISFLPINANKSPFKQNKAFNRIPINTHQKSSVSKINTACLVQGKSNIKQVKNECYFSSSKNSISNLYLTSFLNKDLKKDNNLYINSILTGLECNKIKARPSSMQLKMNYHSNKLIHHSIKTSTYYKYNLKKLNEKLRLFGKNNKNEENEDINLENDYASFDIVGRFVNLLPRSKLKAFSSTRKIKAQIRKKLILNLHLLSYKIN